MNRLQTRIIAAIALPFFCLTFPANSAILTKGVNVKVMPLGDSITVGKVVKTGGYRSVLYDSLTATGYTITYVGNQDNGDPANATVFSSEMKTPANHEGYGSFRIDMILNGGTAEKRTAPPVKTTLANYKPDVVLLMIGTNDFLQNWQLDTVNQRLEKLVDTIFESDNKITLLVASIAPISPKQHPGLEELVTAYNAAIPALVAKEKALNRKIAFVDVHAALAKGGLDGAGVHPSSGGYQKVAAAWYQALTDEPAPSPAKATTPTTAINPPSTPAAK